MKTTNPKDDQWIRDNFKKLVDRHAGEYIAVSGETAYFGKTRREAEQLALRKKKSIIPSVMQIPHKESLSLICWGEKMCLSSSTYYSVIQSRR